MADNFYGKYRAEVVDINDPEHSGRVRFKCPKVLGDLISNWALPCLPPHITGIPPVGTMIWVEFEEGRKDAPIWTGCFYTASQWTKSSGGGDSNSVCISPGGDVLISPTKGVNFSCSGIASNQKFPESKHADLASELG